MALTPEFTDDFNRSDRNLAGDADWIDGYGAQPTNDIDSNRIEMDAADGYRDSVTNDVATSADQYTQVTATCGSSNGGDLYILGLQSRYGDGDGDGYTSYFIMDDTSYRVELYRQDADSDTQINSGGTVAVGGTYEYRIESEGSTQRVFWDGTEEITQTDTNHSAADRGGMWNYRDGGSATNVVWDDFEMGIITSSSLVEGTAAVAGAGAYAGTGVWVNWPKNLILDTSEGGGDGKTSTSIFLTWDAVNGAAGYDILRDTVRIETKRAGTTYEDSGLDAATEYDHEVKAVF